MVPVEDSRLALVARFTNLNCTLRFWVLRVQVMRTRLLRAPRGGTWSSRHVRRRKVSLRLGVSCSVYGLSKPQVQEWDLNPQLQPETRNRGTLHTLITEQFHIDDNHQRKQTGFHSFWGIIHMNPFYFSSKPNEKHLTNLNTTEGTQVLVPAGFGATLTSELTFKSGRLRSKERLRCAPSGVDSGVLHCWDTNKTLERSK